MSRGFGSMGIVLAATLGAGCQPTSTQLVQAPLIESYGWQVPGRGIQLEGAAALRAAGVADSTCRALQLPWRGPAQCGPGAVLRPGRSTCSVFRDMSPKLDPIAGFYRGERDRSNWLPTGSPRMLELLAAYVVDNGEGDLPPHGPYGNLYWDVFGAFEPLMVSADGARKRRLSRSHVLRGPHRTHGTTDEWLDDEVLAYSHAGLYRWGSEPGTEQAIVLRLWESDGHDDGWFGRRNDVLGMEPVQRRDTETPCGVWVPFHRYTSQHPRRRTTEPAVYLLLRTRVPPGPFGGPASLGVVLDR